MIMSKNPHCSLALNIVYGTDLKFSILIRSILSRFLKCWICCPGGSVVKNPPANARDASSIPGSGRSPGEGNGNPLQYSCLENPMDRGAWQATVYVVIKEWDTTEQLKQQMIKIVSQPSLSVSIKYHWAKWIISNNDHFRDIMHPSCLKTNMFHRVGHKFLLTLDIPLCRHSFTLKNILRIKY